MTLAPPPTAVMTKESFKLRRKITDQETDLVHQNSSRIWCCKFRHAPVQCSCSAHLSTTQLTTEQQKKSCGAGRISIDSRNFEAGQHLQAGTRRASIASLLSAHACATQQEEPIIVLRTWSNKRFRSSKSLTKIMGMNLPHCPFSLETSRLTVSKKPASPSLARPVELHGSLPP